MRLFALSAIVSMLIASTVATASTSDLAPRHSAQNDNMILTPRWEVRKNRKNSRKVIEGGKMTFYYGKQLLGPACGGEAPTDNSPTAAVSLSKGLAKCGDRIAISDKHGRNHFTVTVVDDCAGCDRNHVDVTKGVFQHFATLVKGELEGLTFTVMPN